MSHVKGGNAAVTTTAASLTDFLGLSTGIICKSVTVKLSGAASTTCYLGQSDVSDDGTNAYVELSPDQGYHFYSGDGWLFQTDDIFIAGAEDATNIAFVTLVS